MIKIGIQKLFWDAFELALRTQTKILARDIADSLGVDAAPLLASLLNEKTEVYLFEESNSEDIEFALDARCKHYTPIPGKPHYVTECMEPVVWSANSSGRVFACLHHSLHPCPLDRTWTVFTPVAYDDAQYYVDKVEQKVYTVDGELCGRYSDGRLHMFTVDEAE